MNAIFWIFTLIVSYKKLFSAKSPIYVTLKVGTSNIIETFGVESGADFHVSAPALASEFFFHITLDLLFLFELYLLLCKNFRRRKIRLS